MMLVAVICAVVTVLILRAAYLMLVTVRRRQQSHIHSFLTTDSHKHSQLNRRVKTMIVLGSGGHTAEMVAVLEALPYNVYQPRIYVLADTDSKSMEKLRALENSSGITVDSSQYSVCTIPRSREVGQSYLTSVLTTLHACVTSIMTVFRYCPDVILCNGPGTCVPICGAAFMLKVLGVKSNLRAIFIESICRTETLSLTAFFLYPFIDVLLVQWPGLAERYRHTAYIGRLV